MGGLRGRERGGGGNQLPGEFKGGEGKKSPSSLTRSIERERERAGHCNVTVKTKKAKRGKARQEEKKASKEKEHSPEQNRQEREGLKVIFRGLLWRGTLLYTFGLREWKRYYKTNKDGGYKGRDKSRDWGPKMK